MTVFWTDILNYCIGVPKNSITVTHPKPYHVVGLCFNLALIKILKVCILSTTLYETSRKRKWNSREFHVLHEFHVWIVVFTQFLLLYRSFLCENIPVNITFHVIGGVKIYSREIYMENSHIQVWREFHTWRFSLYILNVLPLRYFIREFHAEQWTSDLLMAR